MVSIPAQRSQSVPGGKVIPACRRFLFLFLIAICVVEGIQSRADSFQFDVSVGYDMTIHQASWFPVTFVIYNNGPSFSATIEIASEQFGSDQVRQMAIELPTNTRKRVVIPMFASGGNNPTWQARLIDAGGKVREKREGMQTRQVDRDGLVMGALPRNFGGMPVLPNVSPNKANLKPEVARLQVEQFPDNPLALEGLNAIYINSEKALDLPAPQVTALLGWVRTGGHLILGVEQLGDVNATAWLQQFLPVELGGNVNVKAGDTLQSWIQNITPEEERELVGGITRNRVNYSPDLNAYSQANPDPEFKKSEITVATGTLRDGRVVIGSREAPLAIQANRGRGTVTVLTFSPEREPFRSWKNRNLFWAKLCRIPGDLFSSNEAIGFSHGISMDGVFGSLIDSRQIKKLPVEWLLLLLVVYLVVIGPFDQWWLKKINRQMLTWITFPTYVALFSVLIYYIGYKLRAGETEWNELSVVDVLPRGDKADLRGRSYISIYSSANARYPLAGEEGFSALRGELLDLMGTSQQNKTRVLCQGNGYTSEVSVPVWTSLLYENDWFKTNEIPFVATVQAVDSGWIVEMENGLDQSLTDLRIVVGTFVFDLGALAPHEKKSATVRPELGTVLQNFVLNHAQTFDQAVNARRNALGGGGMLEDRPLTATVASLYGFMDANHASGGAFFAPPGLDLSPVMNRGDAVIFAFAANRSFTAPINKFNPPRLRRDTLLRFSAPVKKK